ncbi:MAG: ATP-binding protein [Anaerolineae bacterium]
MASIDEILKKSYGTKSQTNTATSSSDSGEGFQLNAASGTSLDPNLLKGVPGGDVDCEFCSGTGFMIPEVPTGDPRFGRAVVCVCRQTHIEANKSETLTAKSQLGLLTELTFENFMPDGLGLKPREQRNLSLAYNFVREYAEHPSGWIILHGGYGCGKTHLAAAVANHRIALGHPALFINTPDLLDHLRATYSPNSPQSYDARFEEVRNSPLLILDDLGSQNNTDWVQEKLYQIFNHRYNAKLPTIITTNDETETLDMRIRSRLEDVSIARKIVILAPDFRRGGAEDQSELSTLDLHDDKTFQSFDLRGDDLPRNQADNLQRAFELAVTFADRPEGWLVYSGIEFANGKTHLAAAIANHFATDGDAALFVVVPDLLDHLRATFNPKSAVTLDKRFNEVKTAPLLILDDLGTESATSWAKEKLYQLINYRYNAKLPTVITTSLTIEELDGRIRSRLLDQSRCTYFVIEAPSYRGKPRASNGRGRRRSR